jgi:hypothetical protein
MERKNFKRKIFSCIAIWGVFIGSLLLYSPDSNAITSAGDPVITISTPVDDSVFNSSTVTFTGTVSDDTTTPDRLSVKVYEQPINSASPVDITDKGISPVSETGEFTYTNVFSQGKHTVIFSVTDENGNHDELTWTFTVNYVTEMNLVPENNDPNSYRSAADMTEVPLDYKIRLVLNNDGTEQTTKPVLKIQKTNGEDVPVNAMQEETKDNKFVYTFTPVDKLDPRTTFYVYLNPSFDDLKTVPSLFKFSTMSDEDPFQKYKFGTDTTNYNDPNNKRQPDNIHGNFSLVTNSCAYCHGVHNAKNDQLEGGKYGDSYSNLCMACHDGTISTAVDVKSINHQSTDPNNFEKTSSCTSCHNPHADWTLTNPNLEKDKK